jgi:co-chaperonin GroES (HSP10)
MTEGGIIIPGMAKVATGECVVIDVGDNPPDDLGLEIGMRVQVAKYMGSQVDLREKWVDEDGNEELVTRSYITIDASHILNTFQTFE